VRRAVSRAAEAVFVHQHQQLGTGHAMMCVLPHLGAECEQVLVLCGDVPLVTESTLKNLIADHERAQRDATLLAIDLDNPFGYGRVLLDHRQQICGIVEETDATDIQRAIKTINSGIYCIKRSFLAEALPRLTRSNVQGEFYLTDIIRIGYDLGRNIGLCRGDDPQEILGINTPDDVDRVEAILKERQKKVTSNEQRATSDE
jgi:bifunctional UDP-N-acetylglucosamine pyrophosphorylase/glucosamine-1-phosphate N-acetyltransferase/UDP-N-acetylglucosamine pyrophosphorylase